MDAFQEPARRLEHGPPLPVTWAARPGDLIKAITLRNPTFHRFAFTVMDGHQEMNINASGACAGKTADFVLENPALAGGGRSDLENVGTISFTNAFAFYGGGTAINGDRP